MPHGSTDIPGMRFACDRTWDGLTPDPGSLTGSRRYCDRCQKPVIDFTGWSREELVAWFKREPDTCGVFERQQVDPRYVPIEEVGRSVRRGFLAVVAAFSLGASQAQAPTEPPRTEQGPLTPGSAREWTERERLRYSVNPKKSWEVCPATPDKTPRRNKLRVYLSGSFPFVHVGKRRFRTVGCPSF